MSKWGAFMKNVSSIDIFKSKQEKAKRSISLEQPKQGYCTIESVKLMLSLFKRHKPFFMHKIKTSEEYNLIASEWFYMLKSYRESDRRQVTMMFLSDSSENVVLGDFMQTIKSVAHRNAIAREQKQRENRLAIGMKSTSKEAALNILSNLKQQIV